MYYRILLAADLTDSGKITAKTAWEIANQFDATLYAMHVIEPIFTYGYPGLVDFLSTQNEEASKELSNLGRQYIIPEENLFLITGSPKAEILTKAKELEVDLIVVGSHGRHGLASLLGSTASSVLHNAECDVLTVRLID